MKNVRGLFLRTLFTFLRSLQLPFVCVLVAFAGCTALAQRQQAVRAWMVENGKIKVLCTNAFVGGLVQEVGGDFVDVLVLIPQGSDPHSYRLVKGDHEKFRRADLILCSGLGLERGTSLVRFLDEYRAFCIGEDIEKRTDRTLHLGTFVDPHIWMDVALWANGTFSIAERLATIRPDLASHFSTRAHTAFTALMQLHGELRQKLQAVPAEKRYVVTTHDAFQYFSRAYLSEEGEVRCLAPEGLSPESQISTRELASVVEFIVRHKISKIFAESGVNRDSINKIISACEGLGRPVCVARENLFSDCFGEGMTYESIMRHNAGVIAASLLEDP